MTVDHWEKQGQEPNKNQRLERGSKAVLGSYLFLPYDKYFLFTILIIKGIWLLAPSVYIYEIKLSEGKMSSSMPDWFGKQKFQGPSVKSGRTCNKS